MAGEAGVVRVTATLSRRQEAALKAMAARHKVSVAWLIRHSVDQLIDKEFEVQLPLDIRAGAR
jgi:hypothetical protein